MLKVTLSTLFRGLLFSGIAADRGSDQPGYFEVPPS
jgi:hypothetical protein